MDTKPFKSGILVAALVLGLSIFFGLWVHGYQNNKARNTGGLTVTGSVKRKVDSDLAKWNSTFTKRAELYNLKAVLEQSENDVKKIKKFITDMGFDEKDITFLPVQTDPIYEQKEGYGFTLNVIGYNVRQEFKVENHDIAKMDKLANEAKRLIDFGVVPEYQRTEYFYTKLADLRPELFAEATKDAKNRAEAIAKGTGNNVGKLLNAKTGVIQISQPNSIDVSDYGYYDTSTKEKEIMATVTVTFEMTK